MEKNKTAISKQMSRCVSEAFLRYARYGFDRRRLSCLDMYECIRGSTVDRRGAKELLAVYDTLRLLAFLGRHEDLHAVRAVYFAGYGRRLRRNEVSARVRRFATENYLDDRTVYRRLAEVKRLFLSVMEGNFDDGGNLRQKDVKNLKKPIDKVYMV